MASDTNESNQPRTIGPFEVKEPPARGGSGDVYEAVDPKTGRAVAVKVLSEKLSADEERAARFVQQVEKLEQLDHPNLVRVLDHGREGERIYYVMEHVGGSSLAERLRGRRTSLREALKITKCLCLGLEAAHRKDLIHGNLSPRVTLVTDDLSVVKVTNLGLSRLGGLSSDAATMATTEISLGGVQYAAPEVTAARGEADPRSDIYSIGVMLYEMLTGRVPVGRYSLPSQVDSEVPPQFDPIVLKCLATDPAERYASARQLHQAIVDLQEKLRMGLVDELSGFSRSTTKILLRSASPLKQRWFRLAMVVAGVAAAAIVAVALWTRGGAEPSAEDMRAVLLVDEAPAYEEGRQGEEPGPLAVEPSIPELPDEPEVEEGAPPDEPATSAPAAEDRPERPAARAEEKAAPAPSPTERQESQGQEALEEARQALRIAQQKIDAGLEEQAIADLRNFLSSRGDSPLQLDAYLLMARAYEKQEETADAMAVLVEVQTRFGDDPRAADANYHLGEMTLESGGRGRQLVARTLFSQVADRYPNSPRAPEALAQVAGIELDEKIRERDPEGGGEVPAALVTYRELTRRYPDHPAVETALWQLGKLYEDLKRFELSASSFAELGERFPATSYEAWWEAAQIFEKRLNDDPRARAAYQKVPEGSRHYSAAQRRLRKLG